VSRRYRQFLVFHEKLKQTGIELPVVPRKHLRSKADNVVSERLRAFDFLMYFVSQNEVLYLDKATKEFLTTDNATNSTAGDSFSRRK